MSEDSFKVICIGPVKSGKTVISNFLSKKHKPSEPYSRTIGVRILTFERNNVGKVRSQSSTFSKNSIELWDVSGDEKYSSTWNAVAQDTDGIIFVYNPDKSGAENLLLYWNEVFQKTLKLRKKCCLVLAHYKISSSFKNLPKLPTEFDGMIAVSTNIEKAEDKILKSFDVLLSNMIIARREKEERLLGK